MTVDVGLKSAERKTFSYIKRVISVFIKCNVEVTGKTVSVFWQDLKNPVCYSVQGQIFFTGGLIASVILKSQGIGQNIGSYHFAVSVINISPCTFQHTGFGDAVFKFADIVFTLNDLQFKNLPDQDKCHCNKYKDHHSCSFQLNFFNQFFYFSTQIDSLSFLTGVIKWWLI